jgi:hypothetical protein
VHWYAIVLDLFQTLEKMHHYSGKYHLSGVVMLNFNYQLLMVVTTRVATAGAALLPLLVCKAPAGRLL